LSVAQRDDVSHVSPLESSSSVVRLNHPVFAVGVDPFRNRDDSFESFLLLDDEEPPRRKPSMALPIIRASTIALFPSHFNRFSGERCSFFFFAPFAFSRDVVAVLAAAAEDDDGLLSVSLSNVSLANDTVACAEDFTVLVFVRLDAGMCRFVNQLLAAAAAAADDFESSVNCCLTPFRMDTSKLFERFDFLRLLLRSGRRKLLLLLPAADDLVDIGGCV
jgi:hypothetical protein